MSKIALIQSHIGIFGIGDDSESAWNDATQFLDHPLSDLTYEEYCQRQDEGYDEDLYFAAIPDAVAAYTENMGGNSGELDFADRLDEQESYINRMKRGLKMGIVDSMDYSLTELEYIIRSATGNPDATIGIRDIPTDYFGDWGGKLCVTLPTKVLAHMTQGMSVAEISRFWHEVAAEEV